MNSNREFTSNSDKKLDNKDITFNTVNFYEEKFNYYNEKLKIDKNEV